MTARLPSLRDRLHDGLEQLSPGYFSMVMATGIISIAARLLGLPALGQALFVLNVGLFAVICALALARAAWHTRRALADLGDYLRGPGYFTFVAACGVLGSQWLLIGGSLRWAIACWVVGVLAWIVLTYTIFAIFTVRADKPPLAEGINGGWLLAVVGTQALAVLGTLIAAQAPQPLRIELNFLALAMWLCGGMLYIWMMSLIFYRYTFFPFSPADLSPPYWINMGAMAVSTLAGAQLILNAPEAPLLQSLLPFLKGFTVFYWATGTWWIPMLLILGVWRHAIRRFPLRYDPMFWGMVFPLGMYAAGTRRLADALQVDFLDHLPWLFFPLALLGWVVLFAGQLDALRRAWREPG